MPSSRAVCSALAFTAALATGCVAFKEADAFDSGDPAGRMNAARIAAATGDQSSVPALVEMLNSDDPAERLVAIGALERLTGQRLGYDPTYPPSFRHESITRWREWVARRPAAANVVSGRTGP